MKLFVLCGLLAVALATTTQSWLHISEPFRSGHEYVYRYKSQIASGIGSIDQHSTHLLTSNVHIHFESERVATLRLQQVKVGVRNDIISEPHRLQHTQSFEDRDIDSDLLEQLHMPLRFEYVDGLIESINFNEKDSSWSKNIKRAVLNLLQLNLKRRSTTVQGMDFEQSLSSMEDDKSSSTRMFTMPETTLEGYCQTVYTMDSRKNDNELFNVTKSIDFNQCKKVAFLRYGPRVEMSSFESKLEKLEKIEIDRKQQLDRSTVFRYQLTGTPENYGLGRVEVRSQYVYRLMNAESEQPMQSIVVGELVLRSAEKKNHQQISVSQKDEELFYSMEWDNLEKRFFQYGDEEFTSNETPFTKVQNKVQTIVKHIQQIEKDSWDLVNGISSQSALKLQEVAELVRMCTLRDLKDIASELEGKQNLFHDILAIAGTRNTIHYLVEKTMKDEIPVSKAVQALRQLNGLYIISKNQVDDILRLCKSDITKRSSALRQSCWLTFGSMVSELCKESSLFMTKETQEQCPVTLQDKYHNVMINQYRDAKTTYEKVLALKTIGNAALHKSVWELEKIILGQNESPIIRQQAIDALRRYRTQMPRKVQRILLPVFKNVQERPEIRMNAFAMIMYTIPENTILDQITYVLFNERSQHVRSFVYTTLQAYSRSPIECERELARHLQAVLKMPQMSEFELRKSQYYRIPIYSQEQQEGLLLNLASGYASSNLLPHHMSLSMDTLFNGLLEQKNLELTLTQTNLEQLFTKIYEKLFNSRQVLRSNRRSSMENGRDFLENVFDTLKIQRNGNKVGFGMLSLRIRDIDYVVLPLSEESLPEMLEDLSLSDIVESIREPRNFRYNIFASLHERVMKIATSAGLPLRMSHVLPVVASAQGKSQVNYQDGKIKGKLHFMPMISAVHTQKMEIWTPFVNTGVESQLKLALNFPIDMQIMAAMNSEEKVKINVKLPEDKVRLVELSTLPLTFIREYNSKKQMYGEQLIKTIHNRMMENRLIELNNDKEQTMTVNGYYHKPSAFTYRNLFNIATVTENHYTVDYEPTSDTPKSVEMIVKGNLFMETEKRSHRPEYTSFFETTKRYNDVDDEDMNDMDYETESENTRRSKFNEYISDIYRANKVYEHNIQALFMTVGGRTQHKTVVGLKAVCDSHMTLCKLTTDVKCSPMKEGEWQLKSHTQILVPEFVNNVEEIQDNKQNKLAVTFECEWGYDTKENLKVRIEGERAVPQKWIGQKWQRILATAFINKYDIVADYKLNQDTKTWISRGWNWFKLINYWNLVNDKTIDGKQGELISTIFIDPITRKYVNMTVKTPREFVRINNIPLPITFKPFTLVRPQEEREEIRSSYELFNKVSDYQRAECRVDGRKIKTFDSVIYKAPIGQCYSVIAKDCVDKTFVVLMRTIDQSTMQKKMKIVNRRDIIEIEPRDEREFKVKVNGDTIENENVDELAENGIKFIDDMVRVTLPQGVVVRFDGKQVTVKLSQYYQNSQCGLCGTMNDEEHDEFRMNDDTLTDDVKQFHRSYSMLKDDEECEVRKHKKLYDDDKLFGKQMARSSFDDNDDEEGKDYDSGFEFDDDFESYKHFDRKTDREDEDDDEETRPVMRTKVIEYNHKLCFSLKAVKQCPRGSITEKSDRTKVHFTCLNRSSPQTRRFLRQARSEDITSQLENYKPSFVETLKTATSCSQA